METNLESRDIHWTDQKIKVHIFICILGYVLSTLILHKVKKIGFNGILDNLLDRLNNICLSTSIEMSGKKGKPRCTYKLEKLLLEEEMLFKAFLYSRRQSLTQLKKRLQVFKN